MIDILELDTLTEPQVTDVLALMRELTPDREVTAGMVKQAVEADGTRFFAAMDGSRVVGCASLCVDVSPTGRKAHVEDVVVLSEYRGRHLGRNLLEHLIDYARRELAPVDIHLTSRPSRVAANALYRSLGFVPRETNVYKLSIQ